MLGRQPAQQKLYAETLLPSLQFGWSSLRSIRDGRYKYIEAPRPELYDLQSDPGEKENLYSGQKALARQYSEMLRELIGKFERGAPSTHTAEMDREAREKLASLGYLTLQGGRRMGSLSEGVDPKDRIAIFEQFQNVLAALNDSLDPAVFRQIESIRREAPEIQGLYSLEALAYERLGNLQKAREVYPLALKENPENTLARAKYAAVLIRLNEREAAVEQLQKVLEKDPNDYRARNNLALLYRMEGKVRIALEQLEKVVETGTDYAPGWINLGSTYAQLGQLAEAEEALKKGIELVPDNAVAHLQLAHVLHSLGRLDEARRAMETAFRLDPSLKRRP